MTLLFLQSTFMVGEMEKSSKRVFCFFAQIHNKKKAEAVKATTLKDI